MLPILLVVLLAWLAAEVLPNRSSQVVDREVFTEKREVRAAETPPRNATHLATGQELVAQAAQRLLLLPGVEAETCQQVNIFGQQLLGSGTYLQLTNGPRLMLRLDLKLKGAGQSVSLQQISDGDTFWVRHSQPDSTTLARVDLRRLRDAASRIGPAEIPPPPTLWMALGGLPKLLAALDHHFVFGPPEATVAGKLPVWNIDGRWKPAILANLLPEQQAAILAGEPADLSKLPPQLPHGVSLTLGRDQVIPLFPYIISYYRDTETHGDAQADAAHQVLVSWKLFNVRFRPDLNANPFDYRPNDSQQVDERTDEYVARLRSVMAQ